MVRRNLIVAALLGLLAVGAAPRPQFDKAPPGRIVQDVVAYLSGEGMNSRWHVVTSRKLAGKNMGTTPVYQWYLSIYAPPVNGSSRLVYQAPGSAGSPLATVTQAHGADMYFPTQDVKIVGAAELEQPAVQDVVVWTHQTGADCGSAAVIVFGATPAFEVRTRAQVVNPCELNASIVRTGALQSVRLFGPYYAVNAALCCPTKPHVSALLSYRRGSWNVTPRYFSVQPKHR